MGLLDFSSPDDSSGWLDLLRNSAMNQNLSAGLGSDTASYGQEANAFSPMQQQQPLSSQNSAAAQARIRRRG